MKNSEKIGEDQRCELMERIRQESEKRMDSQRENEAIYLLATILETTLFSVKLMYQFCSP